MEKRLPTKSELKYRDSRICLLIFLIASVVNFAFIYINGSYFYFSAYLPNFLISIGSFLSQQSGDSIFYIVFLLISIVILIPYLLAYIFSKDKPGWMIVALVLASIDTFFLIIDVFSLLALGEFSILIDVAFHAYIIISLAQGVANGKQAIHDRYQVDTTKPSNFSFFKEQTNTKDNDSANTNDEDNKYSIPLTRNLTISRKKSFVACAVKIECFVDGKFVCSLKNGEEHTLTTSQNNFELSAMFANGAGIGSIIVPAGSDASYEVSVKMGFSSSDIIITKKDNFVL